MTRVFENEVYGYFMKPLGPTGTKIHSLLSDEERQAFQGEMVAFLYEAAGDQSGGPVQREFAEAPVPPGYQSIL